MRNKRKFYSFLVLGCNNIELVGDGFCNDEANNVDCNYDGGDCCLNVNTERCYECNCYLEEFCAAGFIPYLVSDGYCNDEANNAGCNYDDGACCKNYAAGITAGTGTV